MSEEEKANDELFQCKMYITDLESGRNSKYINVSELVFDDWVEFEFGDYGDDDYGTLPYKDFKFFINDYSVTFYSPQYNKVLNKLQRIENYLDRQHDVPIELLVNIKNIIHSEVEDEVI